MDQQISDAELKDMFALFDQNNSGYIESFELRNILQAMGQNPTQKDVDNIIQEADVLVKDGKIDFEEFSRIMKTSGTFKSSKQMDNELLNAFEMFDRDKNGYISRQELEFVLKSIGEPMSTEEINEMFKSADANEDGRISYRASPIANRNHQSENRYCRVGLYIHDSDNPVQSGICPPRRDCTNLLRLPPDQIRCGVELQEDFNDFSDRWSSTVLRYGCKRLAECSGRDSDGSSVCYHASDIRQRYQLYNAFYPLRTRISSIEDAPFLCP